MTSILITDAWLRSSYAALRNLTEHGIRVSVADSRTLGMCQASRRKASFSYHRSHYAGEDEFIEDVVAICRKKGIGLLLPSHDETEILARHRDSLPPGSAELLPSAEHCALFNDKSRGYDFAQSCGVPVPLRVKYSSTAELLDKLIQLRLPRTVIKLRKGNSAKGVFYAASPLETVTLVERLVDQFRLQPDRLPQVEEYVAGEGWGCSVLYWHGTRIASFTHRRVREKISTGGTSTLRESVLNSLVEPAANRIFDQIGWHGLAMSEWKVCPETGKFWFVEVNPRMWGSIALPISAGVEFPYLAWLCASEGPEAAKRELATKLVKHPWRCRWLLGDMVVGGGHLLRGCFRDAYHVLFESKADAMDDFFRDDPAVFLGELAAYLGNTLRGRSLNPVEKGMIG